MTELAELQRRFQRRILEPTGENLPDARGSVEVYVDAYSSRLREALASNFPRLHEWLGPPDFNELAVSYLATHPSRFRSIRWFGSELAAHLEISHTEQPWLADISRWEWALAAAFDAPDAVHLDERTLASIPVDAWPALNFHFHPSLRRLALRTNAPTLCRALANQCARPTPAVLLTPQHWLIWREGLQVQYRPLERAERLALDAAGAGATFADLCDALCAVCAPEDVPMRAAALLRGWTRDQLIVGVRH